MLFSSNKMPFEGDIPGLHKKQPILAMSRTGVRTSEHFILCPARWKERGCSSRGHMSFQQAIEVHFLRKEARQGSSDTPPEPSSELLSKVFDSYPSALIDP
jgi:hypothetical protein